MFPIAGIVASQETALIVEATVLMLIVALPVLGLAFYFAWHYREGNAGARWEPDWEHSKMDELIWWAVPLEVVLVLGALAWGSAHSLDPFKALAPMQGGGPPLTVEVVSLEWKWLFIYPAQGVASVNYLALPEQTPVTFKLTSDAPMNALWIPQLGGQEMTMPGMITQLNLMADQTGQYRGLSSNFSGGGFAGMSFPVYSMTQEQFDQWVAQARAATSTLDWASYERLAQPSADDPAALYVLGDPGLYTKIVMQFMTPPTN
jgi:cytochrome o ubiquinol oxidase subunit II